MTHLNKWILTALSPMLLVVVQSSHASPFYKWVDEKGATHYTQTPPPQKEAKKVDINTHLPADSTTAIKNLNTQSKANLKADAEADKAADKKKEDTAADAARRAKNTAACQQIKASVSQLQSGRRLYDTDAKGERSYLTEDQKAAQIQQANTQIQKDCP